MEDGRELRRGGKATEKESRDREGALLSWSSLMSCLVD